jgi:hypothetical protein
VTTQLVTPNPDIPAEEGMCLQYVRQAFGLPIRYGSATEAWNNSPARHPDRNYPQGVWFPVWWALDKNVNGHVALVAPDGSVYSTSDLAPSPLHHHPSISDVEAYYAHYGMTLTYRGWTEDVAGYPVISLDSGSINFDSISTPQEEDPLAPFTKDDLIAAAEQGATNALNLQVTDAEGTMTSPYDVARILRALVHAVPHDTMEYKVTRGGANVSGETSLSGVVAYFDQSRLDTIAAMSAAEIANAVPANLAQQVIDALGAKLTSK